MRITLYPYSLSEREERLGRDLSGRLRLAEPVCLRRRAPGGTFEAMATFQWEEAAGGFVELMSRAGAAPPDAPFTGKDFGRDFFGPGEWTMRFPCVVRLVAIAGGRRSFWFEDQFKRTQGAWAVRMTLDHDMSLTDLTCLQIEELT